MDSIWRIIHIQTNGIIRLKIFVTKIYCSFHKITKRTVSHYYGARRKHKAMGEQNTLQKDRLIPEQRPSPYPIPLPKLPERKP